MPRPSAGGGQPSTNYTTAGGYTPIPDQQSMGGLGAGDVYIDCCGETVPVRVLEDTHSDQSNHIPKCTL